MKHENTKYATIEQLRFQKSIPRLELQDKIIRLEFLFRNTPRTTPAARQNWLNLEKQLGEAYAELMEYVKPP